MIVREAVQKNVPNILKSKKKGGRASAKNTKKFTIQNLDYLKMKGGGPDYQFFFQTSNDLNMALILILLHRQDMGEILARLVHI